MTDNSATKEPASRNAAPAKKRRPRSIAEYDRRTLDGLDRRTVEFQRFDALDRALVADKGGEDALSVAERQIITRAAFLGMQLELMQLAALAGGEIDLDAYQRTANTERRELEAIGLDRRAKDITPTLEAYLAQKRTSGAVPTDKGAA